MSFISDKVKVILKEIFPQAKLKEEYYVNFKGVKLFFDFFFPQYNILIEVQGRQHYEFVEHFHGDNDGFVNYKKRDSLKESYAHENNMTLVTVDYNEELTVDLLLNKMLEAQNG